MFYEPFQQSHCLIMVRALLHCRAIRGRDRVRFRERDRGTDRGGDGGRAWVKDRGRDRWNGIGRVELSVVWRLWGVVTPQWYTDTRESQLHGGEHTRCHNSPRKITPVSKLQLHVQINPGIFDYIWNHFQTCLFRPWEVVLCRKHPQTKKLVILSLFKLL